MELEDLTDEQFIAAIRQAVVQRGPDWVYPKGEKGWEYRDFSASLEPGCRYVRSDVAEPACLIGVALHKCGVPLQKLREREGDGAWSILRGHISMRVRDAGAEAQRIQDNGMTWGEAIEAFNGMVDRG